MSEAFVLPEKVRGRSLFVDRLSHFVGSSLPEIRERLFMVPSVQPASLEDMEYILKNQDSKVGSFLAELKDGKSFFFLGNGCDIYPEVAPHIHTFGRGGKKLIAHTHELPSGWRPRDWGVFWDLKAQNK